MSDNPPSLSRTRRRFLTRAAGCLLVPAGCRKSPEASGDRPAAPAVADGEPWLLTPGAPPPDWTQLDAWQDRVSRPQFVRLLETLLSGEAAWFSHVELTGTAALIRPSTPRPEMPRYALRFARPDGPAPSPGPRFWRRRDELPVLTGSSRPLEGLHVAIDPGHIGGFWARMEERWYRSGGSPPVEEGELTLRTARVLAPLLEAMGARVSHLRTRPEPVASVRPEQLSAAAAASLARERKPSGAAAVQKEAERLFYRSAEIRARGSLVNDSLRPDLVLCLHFNADGWGNPAEARFSPANHLHVLAHGCMDGGEFMLDDQRLDGLIRLVQGVADEEIPLCQAVAEGMAEATGLPPYVYPGGNARMVPDHPYLYLRNLLANRIYRCPVVFTEPYVMNNQEVFERIQAGDSGEGSAVSGAVRRSIFQEYAVGVAEGLRRYYSGRRTA